MALKSLPSMHLEHNGLENIVHVLLLFIANSNRCILLLSRISGGIAGFTHERLLLTVQESFSWSSQRQHDLS